MIQEEIKKYSLWYAQKKPVYKLLSEKIKETITGAMDVEKINYLSIQAREKSIENFEDKLKKEINFKPEEMQDLAGIRIICNINSDVDKTIKLIKELFEIDEERSTDKSKLLGDDKLGYKSVHFVAKLPKNRAQLKENENFKDLYFEIQIRTILQHAWAEMSHQKNYKFSGVLPAEIRRRFNLLAGHLEVADNEFNSISKSIEDYSEEVSRKTKSGNLDIPLDSVSLRGYLNEKFKDYLGVYLLPRFGSKDEDSENVITDLKIMGVETLEDINNLIPSWIKDYIEVQGNDCTTNYTDLIRDVLISRFKEDYLKESQLFKSANKRGGLRLGKNENLLFKSHGIDFIELIGQFGVNIILK